MTTHTTLNSLFTDIADSIRAKTGSTEDIIADNFPTEIANIPSGGAKISPYSMTFKNDSSSSIDLSGVDGSNLTTLENMFESCSNLNSINFGVLNLPKCTSFNRSFASCNSLVHLDLSPITVNTSNALYCNAMFTGCSKLEDVIFPLNFGVNISSGGYGALFSNCRKIKKIDLSNFQSPIGNISQMFSSCSAVAEIDISNFDFSSVTSYSSIFQSCGINSLQSEGAYADGIPYIYVKDTTAQQWILNLTTSYRPSTWTTANVIVAGSADDLRS